MTMEEQNIRRASIAERMPNYDLEHLEAIVNNSRFPADVRQAAARELEERKK